MKKSIGRRIAAAAFIMGALALPAVAEEAWAPGGVYWRSFRVEDPDAGTRIVNEARAHGCQFTSYSANGNGYCLMLFQCPPASPSPSASGSVK